MIVYNWKIQKCIKFSYVTRKTWTLLKIGNMQKLSIYMKLIEINHFYLTQLLKLSKMRLDYYPKQFQRTSNKTKYRHAPIFIRIWKFYTVPSTITLKCLNQVRKVSGRVYVLGVSIVTLLLWFVDQILELCCIFYLFFI
jgi:hypothetical protein